MSFSTLFIRSQELIRINSGTALVKVENYHVLQSYTVIYLLSVRAIYYYINRY